MSSQFHVPHKKPSLEDLHSWRKNVLTLNPRRRFRHTANLEKRKEAEDIKNFKVAVLATQAALIFIGRRFPITPKQLEALHDNPGRFAKLNGVEGIASKLEVRSVDFGINGSDADIHDRIEEFGYNKYDEEPPRTFWQFVWDASQDLTLIILAVCAVIALVVGIATEGFDDGWYDGAGILLSIVLVVIVTAISDYRQSLQFQNLENEKRKIDVEVARGGKRQKISIFDIVVGDVVLLSTGDQVPADGLYLSGYSLTIDQSSLTGESEPIHPSPEKPFLLAGSMVHSGSGRMLVTAVGMNTEWGKLMSKLSEGGDNETPLQVRLNGVATTIGKVGLAFALVTFAVLVIRFILARFQEGFNIWKMSYLLEIVNYFAISVTILVVAVPEGLPLAVTLSLAYAMKQMMADKALVRNLAACETMGSATCICSDKTGTLTTNCMTVVKVFSGGHSSNCSAENAQTELSGVALELLLESIFLNTSGDIVDADKQQIYGSPTETAILRFGMLLGGKFSDFRSQYETVKVVPFSSLEKKMFVVVKLGNRVYRSFCKGAAEIVLKMCNKVMDKTGASIPMNSVELQKLENMIQQFSRDALRTLCLAYAEYECTTDGEVVVPTSGYTFVAFVGIKDPVRPEVKDAVNLCIKAGIKVRMLTGDNIETAKAIARECNILTDDALAVEGPIFRQWTAKEKLDRIPNLQVLARSSPTDKLTLVQHLKELNEVVAVTGDGTNDAPALHEADIGLAMGISGTEVAKSSADVIILDDNFSSIVNVAKWGRSVYTNIQKFVQFQLTVNVVALTINFVSACITGDAPLTAVQLLWVNLIMDTLGALALATEPPYDALMERTPVGRQGEFITNVMWRNIIGQAIYQLAVLWVLQFEGKKLLDLKGDDADDVLNTLIFNSFVFCQVFNEITSREMEKLNVFTNIFTNVVFTSVLFFTVVFQIIMIEFLGKFADTVPLSAKHWGISVLIGFVSLFVGIVIKLIPVPSKPFFDVFKRKNKSGNENDNDSYMMLASS